MYLRSPCKTEWVSGCLVHPKYPSLAMTSPTVDLLRSRSKASAPMWLIEDDGAVLKKTNKNKTITGWSSSVVTGASWGDVFQCQIYSWKGQIKFKWVTLLTSCWSWTWPVLCNNNNNNTIINAKRSNNREYRHHNRSNLDCSNNKKNPLLWRAQKTQCNKVKILSKPLIICCFRWFVIIFFKE